MGSCLSACKGSGNGVIIPSVTLPPVPSVDTMTSLSSNEVREILKAEFGANINLLVDDGEYFALQKSDIEAFLAASTTDKLKYQPNRFDCDNFRDVLRGVILQWFAHGTGGDKGITFAAIAGDLRKASEPDKPRYHAMNCFITADRKVYIVEPQTDEITQWSKDYAAGKAVMWYVLI